MGATDTSLFLPLIGVTPHRQRAVYDSAMVVAAR